jgi:2-dehydro-3-deoxyphosphogluconate aldolase/(4S)-4-hydroxy-2-oxoglutarate aldolase
MYAAAELILSERLIAIVRLKTYTQPATLAQALLAGGVRVLEFTLTGSGALAAVAEARAALGEASCVGAGTVLSANAAEAAIDAGAQFLVTPAVVLPVIAVGRRRQVPVVCGAFTATEALLADQAGADFIKLFPARLGGPPYLRDLLAPLPHLRFVPTGGVGPENAREYLRAGAVAVAMGSNLVSEADVVEARWNALTERARACREAVREEGAL